MAFQIIYSCSDQITSPVDKSWQRVSLRDLRFNCQVDNRPLIMTFCTRQLVDTKCVTVSVFGFFERQGKMSCNGFFSNKHTKYMCTTYKGFLTLDNRAEKARYLRLHSDVCNNVWMGGRMDDPSCELRMFCIMPRLHRLSVSENTVLRRDEVMRVGKVAQWGASWSLHATKCYFCWIRPIGLLQFRITSEIMNHRHTVGFLGRVTTQQRQTRTNIHALSGIRTRDPVYSVHALKTRASDRAATGSVQNIKMIKSRRVRRAGHVARKAEMRNAYRI
jgi:hypothetical protein